MRASTKNLNKKDDSSYTADVVMKSEPSNNNNKDPADKGAEVKAVEQQQKEEKEELKHQNIIKMKEADSQVAAIHAKEGSQYEEDILTNTRNENGVKN